MGGSHRKIKPWAAECGQNKTKHNTTQQNNKKRNDEINSLVVRRHRINICYGIGRDPVLRYVWNLVIQMMGHAVKQRWKHR
jgi:hypothetical protein